MPTKYKSKKTIMKNSYTQHLDSQKKAKTLPLRKNKATKAPFGYPVVRHAWTTQPKIIGPKPTVIGIATLRNMTASPIHSVEITPKSTAKAII